MERLYQETKLGFSLAWIAIYVVGTSITDYMSMKFGVDKVFTMIFHTLITIRLLRWLNDHDDLETYGLCSSSLPASKLLYYIPLIVIVSSPLWFGITFNYTFHETVMYMVSMLCVGFLEEIIFRGFLFKAMAPDGIKWAVVVSSVTFGVGHVVNLINGSGMDVMSNLCQIGYALAFGFLFVILFIKTKSLLAVIFTHGILNALGAFSKQPSTTALVLVSIFLAVLAFGYAYYLIKTLPKAEYKRR